MKWEGASLRRAAKHVNTRGLLDRLPRERWRVNRARRSASWCERFGQDLDRDVAVQLGVASAKDLPHAAFADGSDDFVNAQTGAEDEGQRGGSYGRRGSADGITPRKRRTGC